MVEQLTKNTAEIIQLLHKSAYEIKTLIEQNQYIKARAFEMLSGMDAQQKIAIYDPYPLAEQCEKMATFLSMKNSASAEPGKDIIGGGE